MKLQVKKRLVKGAKIEGNKITRIHEGSSKSVSHPLSYGGEIHVRKGTRKKPDGKYEKYAPEGVDNPIHTLVHEHGHNKPSDAKTRLQIEKTIGEMEGNKKLEIKSIIDEERLANRQGKKLVEYAGGTPKDVAEYRKAASKPFKSYRQAGAKEALYDKRRGKFSSPDGSAPSRERVLKRPATRKEIREILKDEDYGIRGPIKSGKRRWQGFSTEEFLIELDSTLDSVLAPFS